MLANYTLLIPTHNRPEYLKRLISYYSDVNYKVIILDSSNESYPYQNKIPDNFTYIYNKGENFTDKMLSVLANTKTEYVGMCADDDFIVKSSIDKCLLFLNDNPDYCSVQGHYISFQLKNQAITYLPMYFYSVGKDINGISSEIRLKQLFTPYMNLFYAIHKTENLKIAFQLFKGNLNNMNFLEILIGVVSVICGYHKILPIFYGAREKLPLSVGATHVNMDKISTDKKYAKEYSDFKNILTEFLCKRDNISRTKSKEIIENSLSVYLELFNKTNIYSNIKNLNIKVLFNKVYNRLYMKRLPENKRSNLQIKKTKRVLGYPFYDRNTSNEFEEIKSVLHQNINL